jgi:hypothetical protein
MDNPGILKTSNFQRTTAAVSLNPFLWDKHLKLDFNANLSWVKNRFGYEDAISNASADVYASSLSNLLSLDSKKVISYTKVDSDELDTYGSSSNNLLSIDLIDYIRYTKHTLKTDTYGATTANLLSLNVVPFPLVHYNLSEATKTTISKIIIGVT